MTKRAEEEFVTKCEVGGMSELARLVRRVEDLNLRRELCRALKDYGRRLPSTIEVVCKFCRRKVKKEHVHSYDSPQFASEFINQMGRPQSCPGMARTQTSPDLTFSSSNLDQSRQSLHSDVSANTSFNASGIRPPHTMTLLPPGNSKSLGPVSGSMKSLSSTKDDVQTLRKPMTTEFVLTPTTQEFIVDGKGAA